MNYKLYCVLGTLIYYILSAIPAIICLYIPDFDTSKLIYFIYNQNIESNAFQNFFYRGDTFYTTVMPVGQYVYFLIMNIIGMTFINVVNL